ncbi:MAG: ROK family protein [Candidatus Dormibacteria bacterium]
MERRPEIGTAEGRRHQVGRPSVDLDLHPGVYVLALHIGVVTAHLALVDLRARVVARSRWPLSSELSAEDTLVALGRAALALAKEASVGDSQIVGVGVASGGVVDSSGMILSHPRLGWSQVAARAIVAEVTGYPTALDASVRSIAMAEAWFGDATETENLAVLLVGNVVTCGLIVNGELVRGSGFVDGQIGHLRVASEEVECSCGGRGCLEAAVRDDAFVAAAQSILGNECQSASDVYAAARIGNADARRLVAVRAAPIARALGIIDAVVNPGLMILVGSSMVAGGDVQLTAIRRSLGEAGNALRGIDPMRVRISQFGEEAIVVGPAALALERFYKIGMRY